MKKSIKALVLAIGLCIPAAAHADWEFTHWEMSRPTLFKAGQPYGITLATGPQDRYECSNAYADVVYKVPYKLEDFAATACLLFDRNTFLFREVMIRLPAPSQAKHVAELITAKYGKPEGDTALIGDVLVETLWLAEHDRITLRKASSFATLVFSRPISETGEGW